MVQHPHSPNTPAKGPVKVIELGARDFDEEPRGGDVLTIEGLEEATLECPGCGKRFKAPLGESVICPHCGLEGGT